jgi:hypothetical protein
MFAPASDCCSQSFFGKITPVGVHLVKISGLELQYLLDALSFFMHPHGGIYPGVVGAATSQRQATPHQAQNGGSEGLGIACKLLRKFPLDLRGKLAGESL